MSLQKTIYKTLLALVGIFALSAYGFPAIVRGYGSNDNTNQNVLGASTSSGSNHTVLYVIVGIVLGSILTYIIITLINRGRK